MSNHTPQKPIDTPFGTFTEPDRVMAGRDLGGKMAIVTGGYSGIGVETVRALAMAGADVVVPARDTAKAEAALAEMMDDSVPGRVSVAAMDLADLHSVHVFAHDYAEHHDRLDLLINNAGIMACPETRIGPKNWEQQFGVNHLGHFALAKALMPSLLKTTDEPDADVRVVALSSTGHKLSDIRWDDPHFTAGDYDKWKAYGQSKTANALFAVGLNKRLANYGAHSFAVHPGGIVTPLQRHLQDEEMIALGWKDESGDWSPEAKRMFKSVTQGASTTLWAATSPDLIGKGGVFCEDCDIAELGDPENPVRHRTVEPYAVDEDSAEKLWFMSETAIAD